MSYKIVRIAKYIKKGKDSIVPIEYESFLSFVENDPCLYWYEEVDEDFLRRQLKRANPAIKKCAVYNYKKLPETSDFQATYIEGTFDIIVRIYNNKDRSIQKLKEIALGLEAELFV